MDTSCKKCATEDRMVLANRDWTLTLIVTDFLCEKCGHWNSLKRRKGYKEYLDGLTGSRGGKS